MLSDKELQLFGEEVDRLITTAVGNKFYGRFSVPIIDQIYRLCRNKTGNLPLTYAAAKALVDTVKEDDCVIFGTGFTIETWMEGETDGPVGTAALARAIDMGLRATPLVLTEEWLIPMVSETCKGAGLRVFPYKDAKRLSRRCGVEAFPVQRKAAEERAVEILDEIKPSALICIEKAGANEKGIYHSARGIDSSILHSKMDILVEECRKRGILTIGTGDLGNEIGMGLVWKEMIELFPSMAKCNCPCGGSMITVTATDYAIPAYISNWAAYGIEACLALMLDAPELMHDGALEAEMLKRCGQTGALSSPIGVAGEAVDWMPGEVNVKLLEILHYMVKCRSTDLATTLKYKERQRVETEKKAVPEMKRIAGDVIDGS